MESSSPIKNPPGVSHGGKGEEGNNGANVSDQKTDCNKGRDLNYYPFHIGDYIAHTAHLDPIEDCAYRRLMDAYYMAESALPGDVAACARLIRMKANAAEVEQVLIEFFVLTDRGWTHKRCDAEIARMKEKQAKAQASAAASVAARQAKASKQNVDAAKRTLNERSTNAELPTPTPTPLLDSVSNDTDAKPSKITDPAEIIFGYGVGMLASAGVTDKHARSFLGGLRKAHGDKLLVDKLRDCAREKPLQPIEWLAAALPPPSVGAKGKAKNENFDDKDYGSGVGKI